MRHGIDLKPIHNVKDGGQSAYPALDCSGRDLVSVTGDGLLEAAVVERIGIEPMTSSLQS
jgi:hypothetical protein